MQPFQDACCRLTTVSSAILGLHFIIFLIVPNLPSFQQWVLPSLPTFSQPLPTSIIGYPTPNSTLLPNNTSEELQDLEAVEIIPKVKVAKAPWLPQVAAWLSKCPSPVPIRIPEYFAKNPCPGDCSGHGVCNHQLAECRCFHGYTGAACELEKDFECNLKPSRKNDGEFGPWIPSICSATCEKRKGFCYCGEDTKYPERPQAEQCGFPKISGTEWVFDWTRRDPEVFLNGSGWCNVDPADFYAGRVQKKRDCYCIYDGTSGDLCETPNQSTCFNQCSGNGICRGGFCACVEGWYGIDCSVPSQVASVMTWPTWLSHGIRRISTTSDPGHEGSTKVTVERYRPLIYVYDLPPEFNSFLVEGRHFKLQCVNRHYDTINSTIWTDQLYGAENAFLESLLASTHRTSNPEEADFFYVPVMGACATSRAGDAPHMDKEKKHLGRRTYFAGDLYKEAYRHIKNKYPYWDRSEGRDHIWMFAWDEGACVSPKEIWSSMMLVHWGNTNSKYTRSTTCYFGDNWDDVPTNWRGHHPCYDPEKDLVLPAWKRPDSYELDMDVWRRESEERSTLFYFRGNLGSKYENGRPELGYSMGIRQRVADEFGTDPNLLGHVGRHSIPDVKVFSTLSPNYSLELASSLFCGVFPGDGWSGRMEDSILHGCIPVIIQLQLESQARPKYEVCLMSVSRRKLDDTNHVLSLLKFFTRSFIPKSATLYVVQDGIQLPFENVFDYSQFSVRIDEDDLPRMVDILRSISETKVEKMQAVIQTMWQRFTYQNSVELEVERQKLKRLGKAQTMGRLTDDDAFGTFIQVLRYKLIRRTWQVPSPKIQNGSNVEC